MSPVEVDVEGAVVDDDDDPPEVSEDDDDEDAADWAAALEAMAVPAVLAK